MKIDVISELLLYLLHNSFFICFIRIYMKKYFYSAGWFPQGSQMNNSDIAC